MKGLRVRGHAFKPIRTRGERFLGRRPVIWLAACQCLWSGNDPRPTRLQALNDYHHHLATLIAPKETAL